MKKTADSDIGTLKLNYEKRFTGTVEENCAVIPMTYEVGDVFDTFAA